MNRLTNIFAAISFAVAALAPGARADILAFGSYLDVTAVTDSYQAVPLRPNGSKTITFETTEPDTRVVVTYNASCLVHAYSDYGGIGTVRVMIRVDGVEPDLSSNYHSFCGVQVPGRAFGSHSRQVAVRVRKPGKHKVEVIVIRDPPATYAALYSSSILIQD